MSQFVIETHVKQGHVELYNVPFSDDTQVRVIVIPKADLEKMSFLKVRNLTKSIRGNLSDDVNGERDER
jgi:hypothetical protein